MMTFIIIKIGVWCAVWWLKKEIMTNKNYSVFLEFSIVLGVLGGHTFLKSRNKNWSWSSRSYWYHCLLACKLKAWCMAELPCEQVAKSTESSLEGEFRRAAWGAGQVPFGGCRGTAYKG